MSLFYELFATWGYEWFCVLRFFQGLVQVRSLFITTQRQRLVKSGMFPPQTSMWGRWSPNKERTVLMGVSNAIAYLGNLASNILTGNYSCIFFQELNILQAIICEQLGWQWAFYIYGIIGIIWSIGWILYFRNSPAEMPWIDQKELEYIESDLGQDYSSQLFSSFLEITSRLMSRDQSL